MTGRVPLLTPSRSHDAYIDGVTGGAPTDETAESLARVLAQLLQDPSQLERMGKRAEWVRESFDSKSYAERGIARLL
jgi:glycosyltransferase involved in cell wall biosynthesis